MKMYFDEWEALLPVLVLTSGLIAAWLGALFEECPEAAAVAVTLVAML